MKGMDMAEPTAGATNTSEPNEDDVLPSRVTPALVREITAKVYRPWLKDLKIERERLGIRGNAQWRPHQGR